MQYTVFEREDGQAVSIKELRDMQEEATEHQRRLVATVSQSGEKVFGRTVYEDNVDRTSQGYTLKGAPHIAIDARTFKMSKSRGNVINPDEVIAGYGADALRLYEMFMGPLEQTKPWSMAGVQGVARFLARVWRLVMEENQEGQWHPSEAVQEVAPTAAMRKVLHATIKKVTADIDALSFNTAIAQMMVCTNELTIAPVRPVSAVRVLLQVLNPFAPHLTEELWEALSRKFAGSTGLLAQQTWPTHDEQYLVEDETEMPVQINGKIRDKLTVKKDATGEQIQAQALASAKVQEHMAGKPAKKIIVVPGKLVNIVV